MVNDEWLIVRVSSRIGGQATPGLSFKKKTLRSKNNLTGAFSPHCPLAAALLVNKWKCAGVKLNLKNPVVGNAGFERRDLHVPTNTLKNKMITLKRACRSASLS